MRIISLIESGKKVQEEFIVRKLVLLIGILVLAVASVGCPAGDSGDDGGDVAAVDPCELVSGGDVSDATGEEFGEGTGGIPADDFEPATCTFTSGEGSSVFISISNRASVTEAEEIFAQSKRRQIDIAGTEPQDVDGLGDAAYYMKDPQNSLIVLSGAYEIAVSMRKLEDSLDAETQLAELILPKMP